MKRCVKTEKICSFPIASGTLGSSTHPLHNKEPRHQFGAVLQDVKQSSGQFSPRKGLESGPDPFMQQGAAKGSKEQGKKDSRGMLGARWGASHGAAEP